MLPHVPGYSEYRQSILEYFEKIIVYKLQKKRTEVAVMVISNIINFFNVRVKRLKIYDIKLAQGAAMCVILVIAKLYPPLMNVGLWWFVIVGIILALRPMYAFFVKRPV